MITENQSLELVSTKRDNIDVRVPKNIYTSFIDQTKFRSDMIIGPSSIDTIELESTAMGSSQSNTTSFKSVLQDRMLYSNSIILQSDIEMKFTNVQISQDHSLVATAYIEDDESTKFFVKTGATGEAVTGIEMEAYGAKKSKSNSGYICNPFQAPIMAPSCDMLNVYLGATTSVDLSTNGCASIQQTDAKFHDMKCRMYDIDYVENNFNGLLMPDKRLGKNQKVLAFAKRIPKVSKTGGIYGQKKSATETHGNVLVMSQDIATVQDLENDEFCTSNRRNRGRIDDEVHVTYHFEKAKPSPNYTVTFNANVEADAWTLTATADTQELYQFKFPNGLVLPSNLKVPTRDGDGAYWYGVFGDLLFYYYNQLKPNPAFAVGDKEYTFTMNEPLDQSITITKKYAALRTPLYSPLLTQLHSSATFSNTTNFACNLTKTGDILSTITYVGDHKLEPYSTNVSLGSVGFSIKNFNTKLYLQQFGLDLMGSSIKPITKLFYNSFNNPATASTTVNVADLKKNDTLVLKMPLQSIGDDVSSSTIFYIDGEGCEGCEITGIVAKINGSSLGLTSRKADDLYRLTKENGLISYSARDVRGYPILYENAGHDVSTIGRGSIVVCNQSDMGFNKQLLNVGGITGSQITVAYEVTVRVPSTMKEATQQQLYPRLVIYHVTKSTLELQNSRGVQGSSLWTNSEVLTSIESFQESANANRLHMSTRRFYSGGSLFSFLTKTKNMIPKLLGTVAKVSDIANKTASAIGTASSAVNSGAKKFQNFF